MKQRRYDEVFEKLERKYQVVQYAAFFPRNRYKKSIALYEYGKFHEAVVLITPDNTDAHNQRVESSIAWYEVFLEQASRLGKKLRPSNFWYGECKAMLSLGRLISQWKSQA